MVAKILGLQEDITSVGDIWVYRFLLRHPQIKGMIGKPLDIARVEAATPELIDGFYNLFESVKRDFHILPENIRNMDEHELGLGICTNQCVIGASDKISTYRKAFEDHE
ncbi:hypothetical protein K3495_g12103 [Podosphaera aphanis]|nr:hypothetical protein K3495_g12103 [Podosphaera aphanis]